MDELGGCEGSTAMHGPLGPASPGRCAGGHWRRRQPRRPAAQCNWQSAGLCSRCKLRFYNGAAIGCTGNGTPPCRDGTGASPATPATGGWGAQLQGTCPQRGRACARRRAALACNGAHSPACRARRGARACAPKRGSQPPCRWQPPRASSGRRSSRKRRHGEREEPPEAMECGRRIPPAQRCSAAPALRLAA